MNDKLIQESRNCFIHVATIHTALQMMCARTDRRSCFVHRTDEIIANQKRQKTLVNPGTASVAQAVDDPLA